jgi:hypothetical protein
MFDQHLTRSRRVEGGGEAIVGRPSSDLPPCPPVAMHVQVKKASALPALPALSPPGANFSRRDYSPGLYLNEILSLTR